MWGELIRGFRALAHRLQGYVPVTVTFKDGAEPESFWVADAYTEDGKLYIDTDEGELLWWSLAEADLLVAA